METKQFNYSTRPVAINKMGLDFIKSFYYRPDGKDREWNVYKGDEQWRLDKIKEILNKEPLRVVGLLIVYAETQEVTAIIEFESGMVGDKTKIELMKILRNEEQWNDTAWIGIDSDRMLFGESY